MEVKLKWNMEKGRDENVEAGNEDNISDTFFWIREQWSGALTGKSTESNINVKFGMKKIRARAPQMETIKTCCAEG